jgi:histidine triad (HIT) family protein
MTIFSRIISGEIPSYKVLESDMFVAFLDINPMVKGHVLVVPRVEVDKIFDLPDEYLSQMLVFAKPIAQALEAAFDCKRCGIEVIGLDVPHTHMHLIPINSADDLNFNRKKLTLSKQEFLEVQQRIIDRLPRSK